MVKLRKKLRSLLGLEAAVSATSPAEPDDLFGMSTAYLTMQADLDYSSKNLAALSITPVDSTSFDDSLNKATQMLDVGEEETEVSYNVYDGKSGSKWIVFNGDNMEDVVTSVHFAADTLIEEGFGSRLLAVMFGFEKSNETMEEKIDAYIVYSFRRGSFYPFVPSSDGERNEQVEFKLSSVLDGELDIEDDREYWYPMWPSEGTYPWKTE